MIENINFKVSVRCMTYNQAPYIEDAMNGFCMQQTDFPFVCNVMDDASTDGEQDVIQKYLESHFDLDEKNLIKMEETDDYKLIFARHKENKNCYFAVFFLKYNHYGSQEAKNKKLTYYSEWESKVDYIAFCEGDDYWIAYDKLKKQVDFMEDNSGYCMCFHNAVASFEKREQTDKLFSMIKDKDYDGLEIYKRWIVPTASVILRTFVLKSEIAVIALSDSTFLFGDILLFLSCAKNGKIRGMSDVMSVYRRQKGSVTCVRNYDRYYKLAHHNMEIYKIFGDEYKEESKRKFSLIMMTSFLISIKDKNSPIRFYFAKESFQTTFTYSLLAIPSILFNYVINTIRKR